PERVARNRTGRRFHACSASPSTPPPMSAHYVWPDYRASGNRRDLLPERSPIRIADVGMSLLLSDCGFEVGLRGKSWNGRSIVGWRRLDRDNCKLSGAMVGVERNRFTNTVPKQRLTDRGLIRNQVPVRVAVPSAENSVGL